MLNAAFVILQHCWFCCSMIQFMSNWSSDMSLVLGNKSHCHGNIGLSVLQARKNEGLVCDCHVGVVAARLNANSQWIIFFLTLGGNREMKDSYRVVCVSVIITLLSPCRSHVYISIVVLTRTELSTQTDVISSRI